MALSSRNPESLQKSLDNLAIWAEENGLKIISKKSALLIYRKGGKIVEKERLHLGAEKLTIVNEYKYLGITMHI